MYSVKSSPMQGYINPSMVTPTNKQIKGAHTSAHYQCKPNTPDHVVDSIVEKMLESVVPGSKLSERHGRFLKFEVSKVSTIGLGATFHRLQELKEVGDIVENYSISQW